MSSGRRLELCAGKKLSMTALLVDDTKFLEATLRGMVRGQGELFTSNLNTEFQGQLPNCGNSPESNKGCQDAY